MEIIKNYLDKMFEKLPRTQEIEKLKEDLFNNMEDKYNELILEGKSENEAIGIVISEFGNIDKLVKELNINIEKEVETKLISEEEVEDYIKENKKSAWLISGGVALILSSLGIMVAGVSAFESISQNERAINIVGAVGVIFFLMMIAIAVGMFILSGMKLEKYESIFSGNYTIPYNLEQSLKMRKEAEGQKYMMSIIIGVVLCIMSVIPVIAIGVFIENEKKVNVYNGVFDGYLNGYLKVTDGYAGLSVAIMFLIFAVACVLLIRGGINRKSYDKLLKEGEFTYKKGENKVIAAVSAIVWPLATVIFLVWGLVYNGWGICWIVWPVTGILFGGFSAAYTAITGKSAN